MQEGSVSRPGVLATFGYLVGIVVFMLGIYGLSVLTGFTQVPFSCLFFLYWAAMLRQDPGLFLEALVGGICGVLLALMCFHPALHTTGGSIVIYVVIAAVLFVYMRGQVRVAVNNSTMLFMTISTMPPLDVEKNYKVMIGSLVLGALYMGGISLVSRRVSDWKARKAGELPDLAPTVHGRPDNAAA